MPLRLRILMGTIVPVVAVALYFGETFLSQRQFAKMTHQILDERIEMMQSASQIKQALVSYDDALFRYLGIHDAEQLREGDNDQKIVLDQLNRLEVFSASATLNTRLGILDAETRQYFKDAQRLLQFAQSSPTQVMEIGRRSQNWVRQPKDQHMELAFLSEEGRARLIRVFSLCDEIITVNRMALEQAQSEMQELIARTRTKALLLSGVSVGVLLLVMAGFALSVLYPMGELIQGVRKVEQGDLDVQIPVMTPDEVGELTESFNRATRTIREQKEQLWRESITDHLTGAYNQRHFRKMLAQEIERAKRGNTPLALLMIDIDHFKAYNDTQGHEFGNEVIRQVVEVLRRTLRQTDLIARYGGDEMAVLLPETDAEHAKTLARRLLEEVIGLNVPADQGCGSMKISISVGGASFPSNALVIDELVRKADEALYAAKKGGRARVHWTGATDL